MGSGFLTEWSLAFLKPVIRGSHQLPRQQQIDSCCYPDSPGEVIGRGRALLDGYMEVPKRALLGPYIGIKYLHTCIRGWV